MPIDLNVVILTYNEQENLPRCFESLKPLACPIYVIDSGSTDGTLDTAVESGAMVVQHPFTTHVEQWSWGMENLPLKCEWVLGLDADQRLTPELAGELLDTFSRPIPDAIDGYYIKRRQIFRGHWIRHGGYYPKLLLKLFRRGRVLFDPSDLLDHHFYVSGRTLNLRHDLLEDNRKESDLDFWMQKHIRYAALVAKEEYKWRTCAAATPLTPAWFGTPDQRILEMKKLWRKLPLYVRPTLYFLYRYFFRGGWIDGKDGFLFHFLHAFWFRVLVDAKLDELLSSGAPACRSKAIVKTNV